MRFFSCLLALGVLLTAGRPADAQVRRGLSELNASAFLLISDGSTLFSVSGFYGYFLSRSVEVGPEIDLITSGGDVTGNVGGFLAYHFGRPGARTVPFVSGEVLVGLDEADVLFGGAAGLKVFVAPGAAIVPQAFILTTGDDAVGGAEFGISIFF